MKAVVAAFNQEKALVGAFSVITNLRMELFEALMGALVTPSSHRCHDQDQGQRDRVTASRDSLHSYQHPHPGARPEMMPPIIDIKYC